MKFLPPKQLFSEIVAGLFVLLFAYTAIMKLKDLHFFMGSMSHVPLLRPYTALLAGLVPGVEISIVVVLLIPKTRYIGLFLGTILMAIFTAYISCILLFMEDLPCSCGGVIQQLNWPQHLIFNIIFLLMGTIAVYWNKHLIAITRRSRTPAI
jgi:hypothetical protein